MSDSQPGDSPFSEEFIQLLDEPAFHMWMREDMRKTDQFECALLEEPNDRKDVKSDG